MHLLSIGSEGVYITRDDMFTVTIYSLVEDTQKTTVTVVSLDQTTSGTPQPAGNTGTTSQPSTPTKAGLHAAENSIAETTAQQTTPTPTSSPTTTPVPRPTTTPTPRSTTSSASTTTTIMMTMTSASQPKSFLVRQSSKRLQMEHVYFSLLYTKTCTLFETHKPLMLTYSSLTLFYSIL